MGTSSRAGLVVAGEWDRRPCPGQLFQQTAFGILAPVAPSCWECSVCLLCRRLSSLQGPVVAWSREIPSPEPLDSKGSLQPWGRDGRLDWGVAPKYNLNSPGPPVRGSHSKKKTRLSRNQGEESSLKEGRVEQSRERGASELGEPGLDAEGQARPLGTI